MKIEAGMEFFSRSGLKFVVLNVRRSPNGVVWVAAQGPSKMIDHYTESEFVGRFNGLPPKNTWEKPKQGELM